MTPPKRWWQITRYVLSALLVLVLSYQLWCWGHILYWRSHNPDTTAFMEARLALLQEKNPRRRIAQRWVPYSQISRAMKQAIVAAEDARFVDHEGFDWDAIAKAYDKNRKKGRVVAGGSTISQQLAKNLFLSNQRTPWRKAQETLITLMLESSLSKKRILEIYLNSIEWGEAVFGVEAAAKHYFGTSARNLSSDQAAWLAAIVPNPRYYEKHRTGVRVLFKQQVLLERMPQVDFPR